LAVFWQITPAFKHTPAAQAFATLEATFAAEGEFVTASPISRVIRVTLAGKIFYVKTYTAGGKNLRRWIGRSRARAEWENLLFFQSLGIPIAPVVAYGQTTRGGLFRRGALVTAEVPGTCDLAHMHDQNHSLLADRRWMQAVSRQIAVYTRRLHAQRFSHLDLKWRNILVTPTPAPQVYFIDCPGGQIRRGPLAGRWFVKDLACLDMIAKARLSRTQRLRFFLDYRRRRHLNPEDKRQIRRIVHFYRGRR
jgi:tRNA A-37 threonylcarbamoyl transferase component Bud32